MMAPLSDVGIAIGETLVVSAENKPLIAIATGTVTTITNTTVTVVTDRFVLGFVFFLAMATLFALV